MRERQSYRARWVFPHHGPPLEGGVVEVERGRVSAVHAHVDPGAIDLGNVAIVPGLINAHTHLEFSDLPQPLEPRDPFTAWIRTVVGHRRSQEGPVGPRIEAGLAELTAAGTTAVGEIATSSDVWPRVVADGRPAVVFHELLGLLPEQISPQLEIARAHLARKDATHTLARPGISPHAPYSVHPDLYRELVALSVEARAPLAVHLAETRAELELLKTGTGEFAEMLEQFGLWERGRLPKGLRPLDYLRPLEAVEWALVVHGNYLAEDEIEWLFEKPYLSVVYCPRTHTWFGHDPHPWRALRARGINVALGTDSRASNPDLELWREMQFLHARFPDVDSLQILEMGTRAGARALGFSSETGSLEVGKRADLAVVRLPERDSSEGVELLLAPETSVVRTMCGGAWRH